MRRRPWLAIPLGGVIVGVLDITAACLLYGPRGVAPIRIFQSVAAGLYGKAAFAGGVRTAALGLALHFGIATIATAVFFLASRKLRGLTRRPWLWGPLYGVAVWAFMKFVVVQLSAVTKRPFVLSDALWMIAIHIVCVGTPIAWIVSRTRDPERR